MSATSRVPRALAATILITMAADAEVPAWLSGRPDTERHAGRAALYEQVFRDVAARCGIDAGTERLARLRLLGAVNHAVEDWRRTGRAHYRAMLPFLSLTGTDPRHCEFRLDGAAIETILGPGAP